MICLVEEVPKSVLYNVKRFKYGNKSILDNPHECTVLSALKSVREHLTNICESFSRWYQKNDMHVNFYFSLHSDL